MPKYELVYFNTMGRAEILRLLFAQAGVEFTDTRIEWEDWPAQKPDAPTGQLPYLVIDGKFKLGQSMAIARHLAREFSLYGSSNQEAAEIDMVCDTVNDFVELAVKAVYASREGDATIKERAIQAFKDKAPSLFKLVNDTAGRYRSGWIVGNKISLADIAVFRNVMGLINLENYADLKAEFDKFENLRHHEDKVANLSGIKEWIANRPKTFEPNIE